MIFLDTHIVVWLYQKNLDLFSAEALAMIEKGDIYISPIVQLELEYLYEIGRLKKGSAIIPYLAKKLGLKIEQSTFEEVVIMALNEKWTRDPFDRIITAHARKRKASLITRDESIRENYNKAFF